MTGHEPHLLEHVLGAKSKVAALRVLFNSKIGFSGSSVAKRSGMGLLAIQNALADLEGLVLSAGLFGSFARGEAKPGSDIDLLVIVETPKEPGRVCALLSDKFQN